MMPKTQNPRDVRESAGPVLSGHWIFSPLQDMTFVLLTPLLILLTLAAAGRAGWVDGLLTFGLVLAMAHYLPGMLRAYGDRALFRRFRVRLIVAPLVLITFTAWLAYLAFHIVLLLARLWGQWHWMMQVYGFARIYDAKTRSAARTPAWLDQLMCLTWFGMCVYVLNNDLPSYVTSFYESGGPRVPAEAFVWLTQAWLALTVAITLIYVIHTFTAVRDARGPNPLKLVFMVVTFVYLKYTVSVVQRPLMGLVMFESWHDIQYLAIVWLFNLNRARKSPEAGRFIRFLFRPRAVLVCVYVGMCLIFGSLAHAWSLFQDQIAVRVALSLVTSFGLLHYYLDGFIWKIREKETSQALGVRPAGDVPDRGHVNREHPTVVPALIPAWARHAALWLLFFVPAGLFFSIELKGNVPRSMRIYEDVLEAFPDSPQTHYQLGRELQEAGRLREAKVHLQRALAGAPEMLPAHISLGVLLSDQREFAEARTHFEHALRIDPHNAEVHNDLGIVFDEQGELASAKAHLERAVAIDPNYALAQNNLGIVFAKLGDLEKARAHCERAVYIDPDFADAYYQLGMMMAKQGDLDGAGEKLGKSLRIDPNQHLAHNSFGEVLVRQGKLSDAKLHFEQALRIKPGYVTAQQNLATTEAALRDVPAGNDRF
jgi:tetratricopeptide (TPR) repeat protein